MDKIIYSHLITSYTFRALTYTLIQKQLTQFGQANIFSHENFGYISNPDLHSYLEITCEEKRKKQQSDHNEEGCSSSGRMGGVSLTGWGKGAVLAPQAWEFDGRREEGACGIPKQHGQR